MREGGYSQKEEGEKKETDMEGRRGKQSQRPAFQVNSSSKLMFLLLFSIAELDVFCCLCVCVSGGEGC